MIARLTIYQRIVALTAAAILLSLGAVLIVTFRGPPPVARPLGVDDLHQILAGRVPGDWRLTRTPMPTLRTDPLMTERPDIATALEKTMGRPAGSLRLFTRPGPPRADRSLRDPFQLLVRQPPGWLVVDATPRPASGRWYAATLSLMAAVFVTLMIPVRRIARAIGGPIQRLAAAADDNDPLGHSIEAPDAPPEVRALVTAMEGMQRRIREQERDRAALLRAIAHDLRTPMTRLSFRVDKLPEADRDRAQADIAEMRTMIAAILDFMDGRTVAQPARVELTSLMESLVEGYEEQGADITLDAGARLVVEADPTLLRRAAQNVIDNALRYGGGARVSVGAEKGRATIEVEDDGPGIPEADIARAIEPFWRGDASRARATGGVGLGLAIVTETMAAMGGAVHIANRLGGGLAVRLELRLSD